MPFLSEADQDQLKIMFGEQMDRSVRLRVLTRPPSKLYIPGQPLCATCAEAEPFARELATLSDKLEVVVHDVQAEPVLAEQYRVQGLLPAILLEPVAADADDASQAPSQAPSQGAVRFLGLPAGYEFSTLVADIIDVSTGKVGLSESTQAELRGLERDLHLQVFVTPT
jgi:alkyl hydroperoxide reductase subunit AhpF